MVRVAGAQSPPPQNVVAVTPPHFTLFAKSLSCADLPIYGMSVNHDEAFDLVCRRLHLMIDNQPAVRANLAAEGAEVHLLANRVSVQNMPEQQALHAPGYSRLLYADCSEEDLATFAKDPTARDECTASLAMFLFRASITGSLRQEVIAAAKSNKLWTAKFRSGPVTVFSADKLWTELSLWYLGSHGDLIPNSPIGDGKEALRAYDPKNFALLDKFYSGKSQPSRIVLNTAPKVSSATSVTSGTAISGSPETHTEVVDGQMVKVMDAFSDFLIINDTAKAYIITELSTRGSITQVESEFNVARPRIVPAFTRQLIFCFPGDIMVLTDAHQKEAGRYSVPRGTGYIRVGSEAEQVR